MDCKEIFDRLSEYIDKELDDDICTQIEGHIENCEPCIAFLHTLEKTVDLFQRLGKDEAAKQAPEAVSANLKQFLREHLPDTPEA